MKTIEIKGRSINLPTTGEEWDLYTSMKCGNAARALTGALVKVIRGIEKGHDSSALWAKHMDPVMDKYAQFGAWDTEPRGVARQTIRKAKEALGRCDCSDW